MPTMRNYSMGVFFEVFTSDKKNWLDQANFIQKLRGVEHVEIMLENVDITKEEIIYLKELLSPYKIVIHAPFMNLSILSPHAEIVNASLDVYKKAAAIAKTLESDVMTFHLETYPNYYKEVDVENRTKEILNKFAKDAGLKIAIENISYGGNTRVTYPSNPLQFRRLASIINNNVGFTLDLGHFIADEFDPIDVISELSNKIFDIHLHDGKKGKAHLELGKGVINLKRFFKALNVTNYAGFVSLEVIGRKETVSSWNTLRGLLRIKE